MIQSACDPGAPQKVTRQAIRGRLGAVCGTAPAARAATAVTPASPAAPSNSRRVTRWRGSVMSLVARLTAMRGALARDRESKEVAYGDAPTRPCVDECPDRVQK